jgi:diaminohydroxyphosphoribosylaminopyrimidine deaminase/5-amino-6-(5-phosphoribosylamino)uracil reductase
VQDPDPRVDGRGFERLRAAGVEVASGVLEAEARRLNAPFFHWHAHGTPLVTLKAAISADGRLAAAAGAARWVSGPESRRFAHHLRRVHGAVLVGAGTVRRDDPSLAVRLPGVSVLRPRVVVSSDLSLDPEAKVFSGGAPTWVYTSGEPDPERCSRLQKVAEVIRVPGSAGGVDLTAVLADLGRRGVQAVLAEGGGRLHASLVTSGLVRRVALFRACSFIGARDATPLLDMEAVASPGAAPRFRVRRTLRLGGDLCDWGDMAGPEGSR